MEWIKYFIPVFVVIIVFLVCEFLNARRILKESHEMRKDMYEKIYDYIRNHTYLQMTKEIAGEKINLIAIKANFFIRNYAKEMGNKNLEVVYKKVREGLING